MILPLPAEFNTEYRIRPKIGLALSGAAHRAIFYIGFLEVWREQNMPLDYIAAGSSGTMTAAAYACGTLSEFRDHVLSLDKKKFFSLLKVGKSGGLYNLDYAEQYYRMFTKDLTFQEVRPLMGFITTDINTGEQIVLSMGDIAHASRISCSIPGIFEPVPWGERLLVDGGLFNYLPADVARDAGMDIVIGLNMRNDNHILFRSTGFLKVVTDISKKVLLAKQASTIWNKISRLWKDTSFFNYYAEIENFEQSLETPGVFGILGKALDLTIERNRQRAANPDAYQCDLLIEPDIVKSGVMDFSQAGYLYTMGRATAAEYIPRINALIREKQKMKQGVM